MEKTYYLDLQTLLGYLRGKSAVLRTVVMLPKQRQANQGYIFLKGGSMVHCWIMNPAGAVILEEATAYKQLSTSSEWHVRIETEQMVDETMFALRPGQPLTPRAPTPAPATTAHLPRQLRPLDMVALQRFPAKQSLLLRTVFTMVNGERSVAQIKAQLRFPPNVIEEALNILYNMGLIG